MANLSVFWRGVVGEDVGHALCAIVGARGPEPPSGSAARLTARALGRGNLYISATSERMKPALLSPASTPLGGACDPPCLATRG